MARLLLVLSLLLPLAGCVGSDPAVETSSVPPTASSPAPAPEVPKPKTSATTASPPPDEGTADAAAPPKPVTTPLAWDGSIGTAACAPSGPDACAGLSLTESDASFDLDVPGVPKKVSATLTWTPASPLTEKLRASVYLSKSCGDGCTEGSLLGEAVEGASPLAIGMDLPTAGEGEWISIVVSQPRLTPSPVYAIARIDQAFHLEGAAESLA
jgi:hypothetical protein